MTVFIQNHPLDRTQRVRHDLEYKPVTIQEVVSQYVPADGFVSVAVNGQIVEQEFWSTTWLRPSDFILIIPQLAGGKDTLKVVALVGLAIVAPMAAGAIAGGAIGGIGFSAGLATTLGTAALTVGIIVGGGMLINTLLPPSMPGYNPSQLGNGLDTTIDAQWGGQTTQQAGSSVPVVYGQILTTGNVLMAYTTNTHTDTAISADDQWYVSGSLTTSRTKSVQKYNLLLGLGDGPNDGIVAGTVKLNGRDISNYSSITTEEKKGTLIQTQVSLWSDHRIEFRPSYKLTEGVAYEWTTPDANFDEIEAEFIFPNGLCGFTSRGDKTFVKARLKVEIKAVGGSYGTLVDKTVAGSEITPIRFEFKSSETYTGGSAQTVNVGTQYVVKMTLVSTDDLDSTSPRLDCYVSAVREILTDTFQYPRTSLYAIEAANADELSGYIKFEAEFKGKIVNVWNGAAWVLQWDDNPAWILWDILTQPVITGDGDGTAWSISRYDGISTSKLVLADFIALETFCDTSVSDGNSGTEKRCTFNGQFQNDQTIWDSAAVVLSMCRTKLVPNGDKYRLVIDQSASPTYEFNIANMLEDSFEMIALDKADRASVIQVDYLDKDQNYKIVPLRVGYQNAGDLKNKVRWPGVGITSQSQAERMAKHLLYSNAFIKTMYSWDADIDAIQCEVGDVVYLTHDAISTDNQGGAVLSAGDNWIEIDGTVTPSGGTDKVLVSVYDTTLERDVIVERTVHIVSGSIIEMTSDWDADKVPAKTSKYMYGPSTITSSKVRIISFQSTPDMRVKITALQYDVLVYGSDSGDPTIPIDAVISSPVTNRTSNTDPPNWNDITQQIAPEEIQVAPNSEAIDIIALLFETEAGGKVKWQDQYGAAAGVIIYQGHKYFIQEDATGTTNEWIYWDANSDPDELKSTNTKSSAQGAGKFILCHNVSGTPYPTYSTNSSFQNSSAGDLAELNQVDTPEIVDEAVTIKNYAYTAGSISIAASTVTVQTVVITTTGNDVRIRGSFMGAHGDSDGDGCDWILKRGSTTLVSTSGSIYQMAIPVDWVDESPSAGTYTYTLQCTDTGKSSSVYYRFLEAVEVQK